MYEGWRVLNLGAGVQSTTVLMMMIEGVLPKVDAAIFADTGWEPPRVYEHLWWLVEQASNAGIPVHCVSAGNIRADGLRSRMRAADYKQIPNGRWASLPYFTLSANGDVGMVRRQCTKEYKIEPIERFIRYRLLGLKPKQRAKNGSVEQWFGISADEQRRVRISDKRWKTHRYPLVYDVPMDRADCLKWLQARGIEAPRSACIGCPFKSNEEWRDLRDNYPDLWEDACEFDDAIRHHGGTRGTIFLHRQCVPLRHADLGKDPVHTQLQLVFREECTGMCGV